MNKLALGMLLVASGLGLQSCNNAGDEGKTKAELVALTTRLQAVEDESAIRHRLQTYMAVLTAADWDHYTDYFTEDGKIIMTEGTVVGREPIKQRMSNASTRMAKAAEGRPVRKRTDLLSNVEVLVHGDTADAKSRFTFIAENGNGGFEVAGSGQYIDEWKRDGTQWRIAARTVDYDMLRSAAIPPVTPGK